MKTRLLLLSLILVGILHPPTAKAYDIEYIHREYGTWWCSTISPTTVEITFRYLNGGSYSGDKVIPRIVHDYKTSKDYTVTRIGSRAFYYCAVPSVEIPDCVTEIGESAFAGSGLASIDIPNSVTLIDERAFEKSGLQDIILPNSISEIRDYTFYASGLKNIIIPQSVVSIGEEAFFGTPLVDIEIPESVASIGDRAFLGCGLVDIEIPNSVTSLGSSVFENCENLLSAKIGNSVEYIKIMRLQNVPA